MNIKNFKYKLQRLKYQTIDGFMFIQLFEMGFCYIYNTYAFKRNFKY